MENIAKKVRQIIKQSEERLVISCSMRKNSERFYISLNTSTTLKGKMGVLEIFKGILLHGNKESLFTVMVYLHFHLLS